ncbi:dimethyladenosine transferase [Theileria orientalis]|uniref:rRNA adenine N(6)-methyltransferase n=1 Tax=Theileria orientalis TaxID=68886 RepID=A0A976MDJ5_THEOR|nr:dimethyladenosine transferase [Theileria orientalis]
MYNSGKKADTVISVKKKEDLESGDTPIGGLEKKQKGLISLKYDEKIQVYPLKQKNLEEGSQKVPKLPPGEFKPRKSLGQNFITDLNLMNKMCNSLKSSIEPPGDGSQVVELGCGIGSLTQILYNKYRNMTDDLGIEIDSRAVSQLSRTLPNLNLINDDVLQVDYAKISKDRGKKLWIIGNLPFYITSQILLCLIDYRKYIDRAVVTAQWEVAKRIVARKNTKDYSILSVLLQIFAKSKILFKIPSQAFYPKPKVDAACIYIDFNKENPFTQNDSNIGKEKVENTISTNDGNVGVHSISSNVRKFKLLKSILRLTFGQKRKKLKSSMERILRKYKVELPEEILNLRPQDLSAKDFIDLVNKIHDHIYSGGGAGVVKNGVIMGFGTKLWSGANSSNIMVNMKTKSEGHYDYALDKVNEIAVGVSELGDSEGAAASAAVDRCEELEETEDRIWRKNKHGPSIPVKDLVY